MDEGGYCGGGRGRQITCAGVGEEEGQEQS